MPPRRFTSRNASAIPSVLFQTNGIDNLRGIHFSVKDPSNAWATNYLRVTSANATAAKGFLAAGCEADPEVIMSPESLVAKMESAEKVFLVTTPSFLDRFTAYAAQYEVPRNCIEITTSGSLLAEDVARRTEAVFGIAPREVFGSTETGGVAWRRQGAAKGAEKFDWKVFEPVKVSLDGGRLAVRSPFSFRRRYVMGDGAELSPDGRSFRLLGRMDRIAKISERRVDLEEMERAMRGAGGVRDAALVRLSGARGDFLGAVVVPESMPADGDAKRAMALDLRRRLLPVFPPGTVPRRYRFAESLPRNPQGKVRAAELAALFDGGEP